MNVLQRLKNNISGVFQKKGARLSNLNDFCNAFSFGAGSFGGGSDLSELTYYTCLKALSESLGKIPCYVTDEEKRRVRGHEVNYALNVRPNEYQTPSQFFTYLEYCRNHYGNCYAFIQRDRRGAIEKLLPLDPRRVQVWINNTAHFTARRYYYCYSDNGAQQYIAPEDMLHVKTWLTDNTLLVGRSAREILATALCGAKASSEYLNDLYQHGLLARAVVKYVGDLKSSSQALLLDKLERQANEHGRRLIALPIGCDIQPLDMKLTDTQFAELKRYSAQQIAAAFGIKPTQLNDYSKASYANSTAQNLSFYVDTLLAILSQYEQEFRTKLLTRAEIEQGLKVKFNVGVILRADPAAQAEIIAKLLSNGVYTLDEARAWLDMPPCDGDLGKTVLLNAAYKPLKEIVDGRQQKMLDAISRAVRDVNQIEPPWLGRRE